MKTLSLAELNRLSTERSFALEEVPSFAPQTDLLWAPMSMAPLSYLPSFQRLTLLQRKRYNQLFALGVLEQFLWFEEHLLCPILQSYLKGARLSPDLRLALENFIKEELKHSEMFWRVLQRTEFYGDRKFVWLSVSLWQKSLLGLMKKFPQTFLVWLWMALFFEERTLDYSRQYRLNIGEIDPLFRQIHLLHMKDEARHLQLDEHLVENFFQAAAIWKKWLLRPMLWLMFRAYSSPKRVSLRILRQLRREFSDFSPELESRLQGELRLLRHNDDFMQMAFGKQAVGRTLELMAQFDLPFRENLSQQTDS